MACGEGRTLVDIATPPRLTRPGNEHSRLPGAYPTCGQMHTGSSGPVECSPFSGPLGLSWEEIQPTAVEEDGRIEVVAVAIPLSVLRPSAIASTVLLLRFTRQLLQQGKRI